jgi:hypothetical protein
VPPESDPPDQPVPAGPVPPGPVIEPEPGPRTGGLSVEEWLDEQHRRPVDVGPARVYAGEPGPDPAASRRMAGWALGLSLLICVPFAWVAGGALGIVALVRSGDGRNHGRGRAIAAIVISGLLLLANVAVFVWAFVVGWQDAARDADEVESVGSSLDRLGVGDCFNGGSLEDIPDSGAQGEVTSAPEVVPCSEPHQAEVFHIFTLEEDEFPGVAQIDDRVAECLPVFRAYVGRPYQRSTLEVTSYFPNSQSWLAGDRRFICTLIDPELDDLMGSMQGSRR